MYYESTRGFYIDPIVIGTCNNSCHTIPIGYDIEMTLVPVKSIFARKKRPWQIHRMLRCIRIKHKMKGSRVKRRMKLKGYEVRGVF